MINNAILENCKKRRKNLSTAWINYKKDSVPHSWILKCLQMYKIHPVVMKFIEESMSLWKTNMTLVHKEGVLETGPIRIKRGIFQGDSLSPLLFTMTLNPLSQELQNTGYGYQLDEQTKISHLFCVGDLELYGTSDKQLTGLINTDVDRIYLPCQEGGRSLMNLEKEYKGTMIGLQTYMMNKDDVHIQAVLRYQNSKALHSVPKEAVEIPDRGWNNR